ncbi:ferric reductase like transmembrane component-domain-containing protein [Stachybotrys elegans]|uniref:Ferric reductase like transmembrane component-domain-containing protein n=1 Tax=Stachybotrys elegans TaxID=80388 RepID=A0A8K0WUY3_9HYPO|nr:ferric reductase like transmembrane component-domain-containing protein [Stachybotrys elegans]
MSPTLTTLGLIAAIAHVAPVAADGTGLIGWGKTLYSGSSLPCAFACRGVLRNSALLCTPQDSDENHGTVHNPSTTPPECYTTDEAFLRSMALCIDMHCGHSDMPPINEIEYYWAGHLGTGTIGDWSMVPAMTYGEALRGAREDERRAGSNMTSPSNEEEDSSQEGMDHGDHSRRKTKRQHGHGGAEVEQEEEVFDSPLPVMVPRQPLNRTSIVPTAPWQLQYNGMTDFETNEIGHSTYTITVMLVALFVPVVFSLFRFVPSINESSTWTWINSNLNHPPLWGSSHRTPSATLAGGGLVPTRGQALYIGLITLLNLVFLLGPYVNTHPQSTFGSLQEQEISTIGNRAGNMAMGNMVAMFVFSARNNILLYITDWSHGTFLLLHRWLGYWTILHTVLHSIMLLVYYVQFGDYEAELVREYWIWGIVGTVAACAIVPSSLLVVRQRFYQAFLATHQLLALIFLIGYYYHIWYCYTYNWGYEIYMFIASGIWATDWLLRAVRMILNGPRTAVVTAVEGSNGEYIRVTVDGASVSGIAYLCFPTLSWRFWETHPFSVASSYAYEHANESQSSLETPEDVAVKSTSIDDIEKADQSSGTSLPKVPKTSTRERALVKARRQATFLMRTRDGFTRTLTNRLASSQGSMRIPVFIEGSYHSSPLSQLSHCTRIVCIVGGVGITTVLPLLQENGVRPARLFWGLRDSSLVRETEDLVERLPRSVVVKTTVGSRLPIDTIVRNELVSDKVEAGPVGIVVSGPPGMADQVRMAVTSLGSTGTTRPYVLVDEGFSW